MAEVTPVVYQARARLALPLRGRILVWDGHDFLAHHRRWDYVFAPIRAFGFDSNPGRYSYDLVHVDDSGDTATRPTTRAGCRGASRCSSTRR